ncbi:hypothetical protein AVEN_204889-1, partial [Araneus ventricosus]
PFLAESMESTMDIRTRCHMTIGANMLRVTPSDNDFP